MKTFKQYVTEAKQVGTLYHYTTIDNLQSMLNQSKPMTMGSHNHETVSFTRNKHLHVHNQTFRDRRVRIQLDGDKISEHHKIHPVAGLIDDESDVLNHKHNEYRVPRSSGEHETAVMQHPFNAKEYITHIHIVPHRDTDEKFKNEVEPLLKKHGIPYSYHRGALNEESYDSNYKLDNTVWFTIE